MSHSRISEAGGGASAFWRRTSHVAARVALEAMFFAAFVFAVFVAAQESGKGAWFMPTTDAWAVFVWGPGAALSAFWFASSFTAEAPRVSRRLPLFLMLTALALVALVAWEAATARHGLWREWTAMDSHFSNRLHRGYYFPAWAGGVGVFAVFAAYLSTKLAFVAPERFSARGALIAAAPMILWALILLRQLWVPAPYFIG